MESRTGSRPAGRTGPARPRAGRQILYARSRRRIPSGPGLAHAPGASRASLAPHARGDLARTASRTTTRRANRCIRPSAPGRCHVTTTRRGVLARYAGRSPRAGFGGGQEPGARGPDHRAGRPVDGPRPSDGWADWPPVWDCPSRSAAAGGAPRGRVPAWWPSAAPGSVLIAQAGGGGADAPADGWRFTVAPYLWAPRTKTTLDVGQLQPVDHHRLRGYVVPQLHMAFAAHAEATWRGGGPRSATSST